MQDQQPTATASAASAERKAYLESREYLNRREAAEYSRLIGTPVAVPTFAKYAGEGDGPEMVVFGRRCLYRPARLRAWIQSRIRIRTFGREAA
jgi:hypothetical protein